MTSTAGGTTTTRAIVGPELREADWNVFERIARETAAFAEAAREARFAQPAAAGGPA